MSEYKNIDKIFDSLIYHRDIAKCIKCAKNIPNKSLSEEILLVLEKEKLDRQKKSEESYEQMKSYLSSSGWVNITESTNNVFYCGGTGNYTKGYIKWTL